MVNKTPPLSPGRRATDAALKDQRRASLLAAALHLLERKPYAAITMSEIARVAGVAKGTTYLYFPTREALFLRVLGDHYIAWFNALDEWLAGADADARGWAEWVAGDLAERPLFLRLVAILHSVLEDKVPVTEVLAFKQPLAARVEHSGRALEHALALPSGSGRQVLLWLQAVVPGLAQMAAPAPALREALAADPALEGFLIDFRIELQALLVALVQGLSTTPEHTP